MKEKQSREAVRRKIIIAAIECTEEKGIQSVTVRDIARRADVNIAAISYYFGSKENLLDQMLVFTLNDTLLENVTEIAEAHRDDPYATIRAWLLDFLSGAVRFPNISKAHIYGPLINSDYSGILVEWINSFCVTLERKITALNLPQAGAETIKLIVTQLVSAAFFPGLVPDLYKNYFGSAPIDSIEKQEKYVDLLMSSYLGRQEHS